MTAGDDIQLVRKIAFGMARGMTRSLGERMLGLVGGLDAWFDLPAAQLMSIASSSSRLFAEDYRRQLLADAETEAAFVAKHGVVCRFFDDPARYPSRLSQCDDAPAMLYTLGGDCLERPCSVAIVGTRHATAYGTTMAERLVEELAEALGDRLVVVSGLAFGIDVAAHRASIRAGVPTVAVLAHGLNRLYPPEHRQVACDAMAGGGMLVTEYPTSAAMYRGNFLARNRIIASLADVTVVVESDVRGGAMSTARMAVAYGREVMAVPGRVTDAFSRGANQLIANNQASVVRDASDVCDLMGWHSETRSEVSQPSLFPELSPLQKRIVDHLRQHPEDTANDLCVALGLPYSHLSAELLRMAMEGLLLQLPGGRFAPID